jgi:hypothetical protein
VPRPEHDLFDRHPTVNSELLYLLKHGRIGVHRNISRFDGKRVEFADGSELEVDTIVCATGFDVSFPFLDEGMFEWEGRYPKLVGQMFPPGYANLYIWGLGQPRGGAGPLITAGSRLMAKFIFLQREWDRPLSNVIARFRRPEARELFGFSETMRLIRLGELGVPFMRLEARLMSRNGHRQVTERAVA